MVLFNRRKYMGVRRSPQGAPLNLADAVITVAESVQYTGSPRTPSVTVVYDGTTLVANTDYFVAYNDNTNVGAATVVVTGTGSFTGTVVKTFQITSNSPSQSGSWGQVDIEDATPMQTTGNISSGTYPFCVRGGYVFSGNIDASVSRWTFDNSTSSFSIDNNVWTNTNGYAGGFCISRDGMHSYMYIQYSGYQTVYMYDHASAWDVSDATQHYWDHGICTPYSLPRKSGWNDWCTGLDISLDGTKLYAVMKSGLLHTIYLATPFDVTSASSSSMSTVDLETLANIIYVYGMQISPDGKRMVLISGDEVYMFNIGTAWDMSTIDVSSIQTFDTGLGGLTIYGVGLSDDGTKMFVKTGGNPTIYVYNLST